MERTKKKKTLEFNDDFLKKFNESLKSLENMIEHHLGVRIALGFEVYDDKNYIYITNNDDILPLLGGTLAKTMFKKLSLKMVGKIATDEMTGVSFIWFYSNLWYEHPSGGRNGTTFIWRHLNYVNGKWDGVTIFE